MHDIPIRGDGLTPIRPLRKELRTLRDDGKIPASVYRMYYMRAKGGMYRNRKNMLAHMMSEGHMEEEI